MPLQKAVESMKESQRIYIAHCLAIWSQVVRSEPTLGAEIQQLGWSNEFAAAWLCTPGTSGNSPLEIVRAGRCGELIERIRQMTMTTDAITPAL